MIIFSCIGLARYAYTMLIPSMQAGLGLSYDRMGFISTGNFCGYLLSVLVAPALIKRLGARRVICLGLAPITLALLLMGRASGFWTPLLLYFATGVGTGFANIPTMVLISHWFHSDRRGTAAGLMIAGNGAAIMLAGFLVPFLNRSQGADGWRSAWLVVGVISLTVSAIAAWAIRDRPADLGLEPSGTSRPPAPEQLVPHEHRGDGMLLVRLGILYFAFGATFMVYGTFIVTSMVREYGFSEAKAGLYWSWVGFFSFFSGILFGVLSDRIGRRYGLALVFAVQTAAYLLAGLKPGAGVLAVSLILYGLALFATPAIMAAAVGDYLGFTRAAGAFSTITIFFAAGQTLGPSVAGMIARSTGSFSGAYLLAAAMTATAMVLAILLPKPEN
nr:YbfB/YjiJ family MFS transporter [Geomonas sp. Red32]